MVDDRTVAGYNIQIAGKQLLHIFAKTLTRKTIAWHVIWPATS